eukprot:CAMPEP_0174913072 /NCGR_PEP_ID=MMETSP0167-20121228/80123_1 /TAXON_ID=38298 /ORGANISM="Rhodella maculata, Strain CCMP736" /LENGTH=235 /DNA_ID=CAMNT_0016157761 /DNA_START=187 /DNA_END=891 /DNA_ORIENTATION=+
MAVPAGSELAVRDSKSRLELSWLSRRRRRNNAPYTSATPIPFNNLRRSLRRRRTCASARLEVLDQAPQTPPTPGHSGDNPNCLTLREAGFPVWQWPAYPTAREVFPTGLSMTEFNDGERKSRTAGAVPAGSELAGRDSKSRLELASSPVAGAGTMRPTPARLQFPSIIAGALIAGAGPAASGAELDSKYLIEHLKRLRRRRMRATTPIVPPAREAVFPVWQWLAYPTAREVFPTG